MSQDCDVIVIGGGHNGLICASVLAKKMDYPCWLSRVMIGSGVVF